MLLNTKNMFIGFAVVMALSNSITAYYTASYKDGQYAIKENKLLAQMQKQRDAYIQASNEQAKKFEREKVKEKAYGKTVYKAVKQAAADRPDDPDCYNDRQLSIINAIVAGKPVSAPRKPPDPVRDHDREAREQEVVYNQLSPRYRLNLIEEVQRQVLQAREGYTDLSESEEIAALF